MDLSNHYNNPYPNSTVVQTPIHLPSYSTTTAVDTFSQENFTEIQKQIQTNESNHAAFMLGQGIRYVWDTTTQFLGDIYASFKKTRASHFINDEDFDYQVHQNINAETCAEGYEEQCEIGYPQAIVLHADYSRDSFGIEQFLDRVFIGNSLKNKVFLNTLAKNHRVHNLVMSNDQDMCEIVKKAHQLGPVRFLYLTMHSDGARMVTTSKNNDFRKDNIDIYDYYYQNLGNQDLSCLELMDEGSTIILMSCNTAKDITLNIYDNPYTYPASIQKLFALHAPQSKVFSANFYAVKNSIVIKYDENSNMQVYIQGIDSESYLYGALDTLKLGFRILSWIIFDLNNPYLNELFFLKPMKEVSVEKSDFCKEVLPYFSMKRFCDRAKVIPNPEKMSQCINDAKCKEATDALSSVHERAQKNNHKI